jgi:hypothetical protein
MSISKTSSLLALNLEVDRSLTALEKKVTPQMNEKLLAELNVEDISQALSQIAPLKAPGPDGFPASSSFFFSNKTGHLLKKR